MFISFLLADLIIYVIAAHGPSSRNMPLWLYSYPAGTSLPVEATEWVFVACTTLAFWETIAGSYRLFVLCPITSMLDQNFGDDRFFLSARGGSRNEVFQKHWSITGSERLKVFQEQFVLQE